jgi:hypothetical protein
LAELCAATSLFTDLGTGQPAEHGLQSCLVAMRLAEAVGADVEVRCDVFYVSLLRFLGCTADAHEVAAMAGSDDAGFLAGMAPAAMGSPREELARLLGAGGAGRANAASPAPLGPGAVGSGRPMRPAAMSVTLSACRR